MKLQIRKIQSSSHHSTSIVITAISSSVRFLKIALLIAVMVYLTSGITVVEPDETALVFRFGKMQEQIHHSGLLLTLPEPIDRVAKIPTEKIHEIALTQWLNKPKALNVPTPIARPTLHPVQDGYTLTGDANIVRCRFVLRYQIANPANYHVQCLDPQETLKLISYSASAEAIAGMDVDSVLSSGVKRLKEEIAQNIQKEANYLGLGIQILAFEIPEITPAEQVKQAFRNVTSARVKARTLVEEANSYRAREISRAKSEAYRIRKESSALANQVIAQAEGESNAFLSILKEYSKHPQVVWQRLKAEASQAFFAKAKNVTVLPKGNNSEFQVWIDPQVKKLRNQINDQRPIR
ncbi:MAG: FtsH protease activity modulator HflK [Verrucomicrobiota bacterium]